VVEKLREEIWGKLAKGVGAVGGSPSDKVTTEHMNSAWFEAHALPSSQPS